jgi:DNA-binding XRE family transcriptional regulator
VLTIITFRDYTLRMSNAIKKIRRKLGMTQDSFGEAIGKKQSAVANYETGYRKPDPSTAYLIIDLAKNSGLKISLEDIYSREEL